VQDLIFERLKSRLGPLLRGASPDKITSDACLVDDLGADSMFMVEASVAIEDEFGLSEIKDAEMAAFRTIGDMVQFIKARV